jgi:Fic family protein
MGYYIHQRVDWPAFTWDQELLAPLLVDLRHQQGRLMGYMQALGFPLQSEASLQNITQDVLKSSEIEGEILHPDQVRSSIARRLGMDIAGAIPADRHVEGVVEMMLNATQHHEEPLTRERLFGWHTALFPPGYSGSRRMVVGAWRTNPPSRPMQVVSGVIGKEQVHFEAPGADLLEAEMERFLLWFNNNKTNDPVIKAAIAHLWFVTIHPFSDGNGRIARAIADLQLARADNSAMRFYSMSAQIRVERSAYYQKLESTQKGDLNITDWLQWFMLCLGRAIGATTHTLAGVIQKAHFWSNHQAISLNDRQRVMLNKLLDGFVGKLNTSKWAKITRCSQDTALRDIQQLIDQGILEKEAAGGRSTSYVLVKSDAAYSSLYIFTTILPSART